MCCELCPWGSYLLRGPGSDWGWEMSVWGEGVSTLRPLDWPCWGMVGELVEMAGPCEHRYWVLRGLGAPVAEDMENMPGKLLGARPSSVATGKIKHNRSKIENFIEIKSNRAAELSPTAGAQPATHWGTKKGAEISIGHRGYSMLGEWVVLTHGAPGRKQSHRHSSPFSLPS